MFGCVIRSGLEKKQVVFATILPSHGNKSFMIAAFLIAAEAAPIGFVVKNGMQERIDRKCFPRPGISRNQPTSTKIVSIPIESTERSRRLSRFRFWRREIPTERDTDKKREKAEPSDDGVKEPSGGQAGE